MGVATYKNIKNDDALRYLPSDEQIRRQVEMAERDRSPEWEGRGRIVVQLGDVW